MAPKQLALRELEPMTQTQPLPELYPKSEAERALLESQARLAGIISSAMDAIITIDAQHRIILFNAAAEIMFGYKASDVMGKPLDFLIPERLRGKHSHYISEFAKTGVTECRMGSLKSVKGLRSSGQEFPLEASISQVQTNGQAFYTVVLRDITERELLEQSLWQVQGELEERVRKRTAELAETNLALQKEIEERKRAEAAEHELRTFGEALQNIAVMLNSTLQLEEVLRRMLHYMRSVVSYDAAYVLLWEGEMIQLIGARGEQSAEPSAVTWNKFLWRRDLSRFQNLLQTETPRIIGDVKDDPDWVVMASIADIRSFIAIPILLAQETIGVLYLLSDKPHFYTPYHIPHLEAFAVQAAVAVHNARLYAQARQSAAAEERNRIADELHDAVSQTLWSAGLIVDVLPELQSLDTANARNNLDTLRQLIRGALTEMRTLLLEMRPSALAEGKLAQSLQYLVAAFTGRTGIPVSIEINELELFPAEMRITLYRIAQEALNNIERHAGATKVEITLTYDGETGHLIIKDDGHGFDLSAAPRQHMGLRIMSERTQAINVVLEINTALGQGTEIMVVFPTIFVASAEGDV
jgi:PAS domain S-box-containing protein